MRKDTLAQLNSAMTAQERLGVTYMFLSAVIFGLTSIYYKQLKDVPSVQIVLHRIVWSLFFLLALVFWSGLYANFCATARCVVVSLCVGVMAGYIIETSLGFFINPIFTVLLAVIVLKEPLRRWQKLAVFCVFAAVLVVVIVYGKFPWLGISLALVLAFYGLIKKLVPLSPLEGVVLEMMYLFIPSLVALIALEVHGTGAFGHVGTTQNILTAGAAPLISFSLLGLLQYLSPIINFFLGIFAYHEPFSTAKLIGFILVWIALTIFAIDGVMATRVKPDDAADGSTESSPVKEEDVTALPATPTADYKDVDDKV
ncbi:hypothetical protein Ae201684_012113 [Aphanomyces euteiches]|uniref:EamA domain-containing protein n=1 Tax=Aphanomyces euteiches TaxID=100861 RepID=A0A6G0WSK7_9STRA|nr:hypothetical protein Ae201684_012113 [Aphanomyces euteiches]KAH9138857.1 hypothetical protein AeRB84_016844 [Aphanomyces euteiches]